MDSEEGDTLEAGYQWQQLWILTSP